MPLDNENIKTILEIIKINQVIMLNIINKEEKPIPEPVVTDNKKEEDDFNKLNKEQQDNLEKAKIIHESIPIKRKYTKKSISATMRRKVWDEYIGKKIGEAKCLCCKMTDITQLTFHCGHIIPECNGGELILSNLRPICQNCNSSMGTKNMDNFMKTFE
jgi:5-methylcytosine-specific restriction endonuclease McrA